MVLFILLSILMMIQCPILETKTEKNHSTLWQFLFQIYSNFAIAFQETSWKNDKIYIQQLSILNEVDIHSEGFDPINERKPNKL